MKGYKGIGKEEVILFERDISYEVLRNSGNALDEIDKIRNDRRQEFHGFETVVEDGKVQLIATRRFNGKISGFGNNLKYFRTAFVSNRANKDQVRIDITHQCTEMLCIREGVFRLLKEGTDWKIFEKSNRFLAVYYNFVSGTLKELRDEMNALDGEKVLYCFSVDPQGLVREDFSDWDNTRLEPIPQKILDIYKQLFDNE